MLYMIKRYLIFLLQYIHVINAYYYKKKKRFSHNPHLQLQFIKKNMDILSFLVTQEQFIYDNS